MSSTQTLHVVAKSAGKGIAHVDSLPFAQAKVYHQAACGPRLQRIPGAYNQFAV